MIKDIKYWAGLFDADGSFDIGLSKREENVYYGQVRAVLYQKSSRSEVIEEFAKLTDSKIMTDGRGNGIKYISLNSTKARNFMQQVKNHLVVKKHLVEKLLEIDKTFYDKESKKELNKQIKEWRYYNHTDKQYPSRKWLAGYIDGDGCINSYFNKKTGLVEFTLRAVSHKDQDVALQLIHKHLGGYIYDEDNCKRWALNLSYNTRNQLSYFGKHLKVKSKQYDLVINVINNQSNLKRYGATYESNLKLHELLKQLNSI